MEPMNIRVWWIEEMLSSHMPMKAYPIAVLGSIAMTAERKQLVKICHYTVLGKTW
jgi:hypothetical protein